MPDTRGRPLPSEILSLLKDPAIQNYLRSFLLATTSSESIGRYPGNGSAQDDQYVYPDDADATFPYNFDYVIPSNFQRLVSARLSIKIRPFRSYNQFSSSQTGDTSLTTLGESGHSHSHSHSSTVTTGAANARIDAFSSGWETTAVSGTTVNPSVNTDATGSSGHTHSISAHHHSLSITSTLGVFEDTAPVNPGITVSVDGTDVTAKVGGPFNTDQVEVDVTQVLKTGVKLWHTLSLQPNQRVRITGILRLSYYVDSRLAQ